MGLKAFAIASAACLLLAPGAILLGIATLFAPPASGTFSCLVANGAAVSQSSASITGTVPTQLTARDSTGVVVVLDRLQLQRAAVVIAVGVEEGVSSRGQLVALTAALTESQLRVLANTRAVPMSGALPHDGDGHDHDSLGLFQMRPSAGWGNARNLMDPVWSTRAFYGGPNGPNHGSPAGLLDIREWQHLDPGRAAQDVEHSDYPSRYNRYLPVAATVLHSLTGTTISLTGCTHQGGTATSLPPGFAGALIAAAERQLGVPYVLGGGSYSGPTGGGFDCSGLVLYAAYQATGGRLRLEHATGSQVREGRPVPWAAKKPGDLIFFTYPGDTVPHHVAIYLGDDQILQAPRSGEAVRYGTIDEFVGQVMTVRRL